MLTESDLKFLSNQKMADLLKTTDTVSHIDYAERGFSECLRKKIELRQALYDIARQNAQYRRSMKTDEHLSVAVAIPVSLFNQSDAGFVELLNQTDDVEVVDRIQDLTEYRLHRSSELRRGLFAIARQGVAYRKQINSQ